MGTLEFVLQHTRDDKYPSTSTARLRTKIGQALRVDSPNLRRRMSRLLIAFIFPTTRPEFEAKRKKEKRKKRRTLSLVSWADRAASAYVQDLPVRLPAPGQSNAAIATFAGGEWKLGLERAYNGNSSQTGRHQKPPVRRTAADQTSNTAATEAQSKRAFKASTSLRACLSSLSSFEQAGHCVRFTLFNELSSFNQTRLQDYAEFTFI